MDISKPNNLPSTKCGKEPSERYRHTLRVAELVTRLLTHYWTSDDHPAARQAQIEDWLEDLAEYTDIVVEEACRDWRRRMNRRPTPADIRALCIAGEPTHIGENWLPVNAGMKPWW